MLEEIQRCLDHFRRNVNDATKAINEIRRNRNLDIYPAFRLWRLLSRVIMQHIEMLLGFVLYIDKERKRRDELKQIKNKQIDCIRKNISTLKRALGAKFSDCAIKLNASDRETFRAAKGRWICRVPQELLLLILRVRYETQAATCRKDGMSDSARLRAFLDSLRSEQWESLVEPTDPTKKNSISPPPLVPQTFCFDETRKRLGISRPTWADGKSAGKHAWREFLIESRDKRVSHGTVQAELKKAQILSDCVRKKYPEERTLQQEEWESIQFEFRNKYHGELRRYQRHTWQATNAWARAKSQCWRDRCYYDAELVESNGAWDPTDTRPMGNRPSGTCAENCLHAEETEWRVAQDEGKFERYIQCE
ncbi:MAG: hypothetical protein Q9157_000767 [Trypethelium eluteriae]